MADHRDEDFITAVCRPKATPAAEPKTSALAALLRWHPSAHSAPISTAEDKHADHHAAAGGAEVPPRGDPTVSNSVMPATTASAPPPTRRVIC